VTPLFVCMFGTIVQHTNFVCVYDCNRYKQTVSSATKRSIIVALLTTVRAVYVKDV
jgi:hypothetical protein